MQIALSNLAPAPSEDSGKDGHEIVSHEMGPEFDSLFLTMSESPLGLPASPGNLLADVGANVPNPRPSDGPIAPVISDVEALALGASPVLYAPNQKSGFQITVSETAPDKIGRLGHDRLPPVVFGSTSSFPEPTGLAPSSFVFGTAMGNEPVAWPVAAGAPELEESTLLPLRNATGRSGPTMTRPEGSDGEASNPSAPLEERQSEPAVVAETAAKTALASSVSNPVETKALLASNPDPRRTETATSQNPLRVSRQVATQIVPHVTSELPAAVDALPLAVNHEPTLRRAPARSMPDTPSVGGGPPRTVSVPSNLQAEVENSVSLQPPLLTPDAAEPTVSQRTGGRQSPAAASPLAYVSVGGSVVSPEIGKAQSVSWTGQAEMRSLPPSERAKEPVAFPEIRGGKEIGTQAPTVSATPTLLQANSAVPPPVNVSEVLDVGVPEQALMDLQSASPGPARDVTGQSSPDLPRHIAQQVAEVARALPDRPVELTLNPEELGRLRLTFTVESGAMTVAVTVERPETLDLMRRHIDLLAQDLRDLGYRDVSFAFSQGGGESSANEGKEGQESEANPFAAGNKPEVSANPDLAPLHMTLDPAAGIDIRI